MCFIIIQLLLEVCQMWKDFNDSEVARFDNEIYKADLTLGDICCRAIVELTDRKLVLFLQIALLEELHEEKIGPKAAQVPWFGRI